MYHRKAPGREGKQSTNTKFVIIEDRTFLLAPKVVMTRPKFGYFTTTGGDETRQSVKIGHISNETLFFQVF
jgi:hypothetical protein